MIGNKKSLVKHLPFVLLLTMTFAVYKGVVPLYFQQDEWHSFGWALRAAEEGVWGMVRAAFTAGIPRPLTRGFFQILFAAFGLDETGYNLVSIFIHFVNSFLVYLVAFKLTKNKVVALISGAFFALNSTHLQAITWVSASVGSLFSNFFGLLSLLTFISYLESSARRRYFQTLIFLIISMGFKETTLFLFLAYPVFAYFLKNKKRNMVKVAKEYWLMILIGIFWIFQRLVPILFVHTSGPYLTLGGEGASFLPKVITNIFLYPFQGMSQIFVSPKAMFELTSLITKIVRPVLFNNDLFIQTIASQMVSLALSLLIVGLSIFVYKYGFLSKKIKKALIFALVFTPIAFLPSILLPKSNSFLESRNYYFATVGGALVFAIIVWGLANIFKKKLVLEKRHFYFVLILLATPFFLFQVGLIREENKRLLEIGNTRKRIVTQIINTYPEIEEKAVFYTKSDEYPYGDKEPLMRFQSGFGHVLLVLYAEKGELSSELLKEDYLWDIWDQGYKEKNGSGFGYFREKERIGKLLEEGKIDLQQIYAFEWREKVLYDITGKVRQELNIK